MSRCRRCAADAAQRVCVTLRHPHPSPSITSTLRYALSLVNGTPYHVTKLKTAPAADVSSDTPLGVDEADALAATLPGLAKYTSTADAAKRAAALLMAAVDVNAAGPYQGVKFDPNQVNEFPRLPYGCVSTGHRRPWEIFRPWPSAFAGEIWDLEALGDDCAAAEFHDSTPEFSLTAR